MILPISTNSIYNFRPNFSSNLVGSSVKAKADEYMNNGNFDKAIELYKKALEVSPYDAKVQQSTQVVYSSSWNICEYESGWFGKYDSAWWMLQKIRHVL